MMASNDNQQLNIEQARELLSPYLDGEVSAEERVLVEEALAASRKLRTDLETLRQTVSLLQALSPVPAPRPFTLSEADVGISEPAGRPRRVFGLPAWLAGLAGVAASLVCVLAVGGLLFAQQFGGGLSAPAELARLNGDTAPQVAQSEAASVEEAAEAPAVEAELAATGPVQEVAPAEPAAPAPEEKAAESALDEETAAPEPEVGKEEALSLEVEEPAAAEAAEDTLSAAGEAAEAEEGQGEIFRDGEAGGDTAGIAPTPTPAPLSTPEQPALAAPPAEKAMPAEAPAAAEEEEALATTAELPEELAESAPPPAGAEAPQEQNLAQRGAAPRQVEIRNQNLSVRPGLVRLEGVIEAEPGTVLQASLWRNDEPFDDWATPPRLQTVVQPGGQFVFEFEALAGRTDRDLFGLEPASYQIVITSVAVDAPVTAVVFFDTYGPPATAEPPTATPTPAPPVTPTAVARVTFEPSPTPSPVVSPTELPTLPTPATGPPQANPARLLPLIVIVVIAGLGGLIGAGLLVWWLVKKQQN